MVTSVSTYGDWHPRSYTPSFEIESRPSDQISCSCSTKAPSAAQGQLMIFMAQHMNEFRVLCRLSRYYGSPNLLQSKPVRQ